MDASTRSALRRALRALCKTYHLQGAALYAAEGKAWRPLSSFGGRLLPSLEVLFRSRRQDIVALFLTLGQRRVGLLVFRSALPDAEVVVGPLSTTVPYFAALVQLAVDQGRASGARDSLTRVYSRHTLLAMLGQSLEEAKRRQRALTLAFVDLSGLKAINEAAGHHAGDAALREMAQAMQASVKANGT